MKKLIKQALTAAVAVLLPVAAILADTTTTRFAMTKPDVGSTNWGPKINTNYDIIDNAAGLSIANTFTSSNTFNAPVSFGSSGIASFGSASAAAPAITWTAAPTSGLFMAAANVTAISAGGTSMFEVGTSSVTAKTAFYATGVINAANGSIGSPSVTFTSDTDTGLYRAAANQLGIVVNGASAAQFLTTDVYLYVGGSPKFQLSASSLTLSNVVAAYDGTVALPSYGFASDQDTGFYWIGSNDFAATVGGAKTVEFKATGSASGTTYSPLSFLAGGYATTFEGQITTGVSTSITTIHTMNNDGGILLVYGKQTAGGTTEFVDLILVGSGAAGVNTISQRAVSGSSDTRTYAQSGSAVRLTMGGNTYTIRTAGMLTL